MDTEFDTGDIIEQKAVQTNFSDTGKDLHNRLEKAQFELFTEVWPKVESGKVKPTPQNETAGTYHSKSDFVEKCELDPEKEVTIKQFLDTLRALTFQPFDNAYIVIDGKRYYIDVEIREATDESDEKAEGLLSSY
jgi:methionyl-tRNA formyltransferase